MLLFFKKGALWTIIFSIGLASASCKKEPPFQYSERLDMKWELIEQWKMVNIETKDKIHRFTYVPEPNEVNPKRYVVVTQSPAEGHQGLVKALQQIETADKKPDFLFKKNDFSGDLPKHLYIVKIKEHTTVQALIKGQESLILINYTDYLVQPDDKFIDEWVKRLEKTRLVTKE